MKLSTFTLSNGLQVALVRNPNTQGTSFVQMSVNVGANHETDEKLNGISHLLEHMAFKGTATKTAKQLAEEMEIMGSSCNAGTSNKMTRYYVTGLSDHTKLSIEYLADIIRNSTFPEEELVKEREVVEQEMISDATNIEVLAYESSIANLFPNQSYGRPIIGVYSNVSKLTREDLSNYVRKYYTPNNMILICVCNEIDETEFYDLVHDQFDSMQRGEDTAAPPINLCISQNHVINDMFDQQSEVAIMYPYITDAKKRYVSSLMTYYLANGSSSPLFDRLREQEPLCYGLDASVLTTFHDEQHIFAIIGSTSPDKKDRFIKASIEELEKIADGKIDPIGWKRTINQIKLSNIGTFNSHQGIASLVHNALRNNTTFENMEERLHHYQSITEIDMINFAKELIASPPSIQTYGG